MATVHHRAGALVFLLALFGTGSAATIGARRQSADPSANGFTVFQQANPGYTGYMKTGQAALVKAYAKYGAQLPAVIKNAAERVAEKFRNEGSVVAEPEVYDSAYLCQVAIGTPPVDLFLDFDTGSADLWVFSTETNISQVARQALYDPPESSTSVLLGGESWSITYGDGSTASGDVWLDSVDVGGITVPHQAVESAEQVSPSFSQDSASSGLLGLAFSSLNSVVPNQQQTFFDNVKGLLERGLFTADLQAGAFGSYDFGFIDNSKKTGPVTYTALNNTRGYWEISTVGYSVADQAPQTKVLPAIVDTGTSLILLPDDVVQAYYARVNQSTFSVEEGGWIFYCNYIVPPPPPDFAVLIQGYQAIVPGSYINYAPSQTKAGYCFGGLQSSANLGINILGDVFIKSQLVVFDSENSRVGFAPKGVATDSTSSTTASTVSETSSAPVSTSSTSSTTANPVPASSTTSKASSLTKTRSALRSSTRRRSTSISSTTKSTHAAEVTKLSKQ